jgi:hypothetical protein
MGHYSIKVTIDLYGSSCPMTTLSGGRPTATVVPLRPAASR